MTRPNQESIAAENLRRQAYEHYCPKYLQMPKKQGQKPTVRPLFPRYIFVFIEHVWYTLLGTRGISRVLMGDQAPQTIPATIIDALRLREDRQGLVSLEQPPKFLPGMKVKASEGPFAGYALVYDGMTSKERVRVLMDLLGRKVPMEVDESVLVAA